MKLASAAQCLKPYKINLWLRSLRYAGAITSNVLRHERVAVKKASRSEAIFSAANSVLCCPGISKISMFGHRRRQAASSLAVIRARIRIAGAFSGTGARSSDAIHGATAWINKRTRSSLSKIGSKAETDGRRLDENRRSRLDNRLPASL